MQDVTQADRPARTSDLHGTIELDIGRDEPPPRARIEALCRQGHAYARIEGAMPRPPRSPDEARRFLAWLETLRDMTACAVPVEWTAGPELAALAPLLFHIVPPDNPGPPEIERWRKAHRFGTCFWRSGPDFITVTDRRDESDAHQYVLDTPDYVEVFSAAETLTERERLAALGGEALRELEASRLILTIEGWSLALPFRMRHWPVPFTAI
jgi:Family of unknown function (DUF5825)